MRRLLIAATTSSLLALATPGVASAAHHKAACRHRAHHVCAKRQAHRARLLQFGAPASFAPSAGAGANAPNPPASPDETAGTVVSFTGGVLTIALKDGSTVSGKVTEATELRCRSASPAPEGEDEDGQGDESSGGNGDDEGGPAAGMSSHMDDMSGGDGGDGEDGNASQPSSCTAAAALLPSAVVAEAELSVGAAGAVW